MNTPTFPEYEKMSKDVFIDKIVPPLRYIGFALQLTLPHTPCFVMDSLLIQIIRFIVNEYTLCLPSYVHANELNYIFCRVKGDNVKDG